MKTFLWAVTAVTLAGVPAAAGGLARLSWLEGCWEARSGNQTIEENWTAARGGAMVGVGRTVRGGVLIETEFVVLREEGDGFAYEAHPSKQPAATFTAHEASETTVVFTNPTHDYPKEVGYLRVGADSLVAWIKGPGRDGSPRRVEFRYRRVPCAGPAGDTGEQGPAGAWRGKIRFENGAFAAIGDLEFLYVFNAGGTMTESSNYDGAPPVPPAYGIWRRTGERRFECRYVFYSTLPPKSLEELAAGGGWMPGGHGVLHEQAMLAPDGRSFTSTITYEAFDRTGTKMEGGGEGRVEAERIEF